MWAKIVLQLRRFGIVGMELEVIKDYFVDRYAVLRFRGVEAEKKKVSRL